MSHSTLNKALSSLSRWFGVDVERLSSRSITFTHRKRRKNAWFSHRYQMQHLFEQQGIDLVLDVGANEGQFARELRRFYQGDLISFEPVRHVFDKLSAAAAGDPSWQLCNVALGRQERTATIHVSAHSVFSSLHTANASCRELFGAKASDSTDESITIRRIDKVLPELVNSLATRRIFLKLDTQGYDLEAFAGLGSILDQVLALQSEVSLIPLYEGMPHWTECVSTYEQAGFGVVGMYPVNHVGNRVIEYDCLMTRVKR